MYQVYTSSFVRISSSKTQSDTWVSGVCEVDVIFVRYVVGKLIVECARKKENLRTLPCMYVAALQVVSPQWFGAE